jgi:hypothetical protein
MMYSGILDSGQKIVTDGLVLHLDAAQLRSYPGSGTTWTDLSGNGNNGTLVNGVGYSGSNLGSLSFDGVDDYVSRTTTSGDSLNFISQMSFNVWVYPITGAGLYIFAKNLNAGYADQQYGCDFEGNRTRFILSGNEFLQSTTNSVPFNVWTNICGTWNGTIQRIYINSLLNVERSFSTSPTFKPNLFVGWRSNGLSSHYFKGFISNLNFYNRALSAQEIQQNYNATKGRYGL